ncbi:MAG: hypothetical protein HZB43_02495 [candidate division Zixibacteria bacterium]|nr:hypothetical protein [candidate division Zixibacteria bacterium]
MIKAAQSTRHTTGAYLAIVAILLIALTLLSPTASAGPSKTVSGNYIGYTLLDDPSDQTDSTRIIAPSLRDSLSSPRDSSTQATKSPGPTAHGRRAGHGLPPRPGGFFRSPTGTLLKSVAFPGWGQWSNGKKQKAAVYFGIETFFLTKALIWRHRAADRLRTWENTDPTNETALREAFSNYDSARNSRNYFYWLAGITTFISMFDAYADCYLLTLENTRKMGDDYWGGQARVAPDDELRVAVTWHF